MKHIVVSSEPGCDYHMHSTFCNHVEPDMTIDNIVRRAEAIGLKRMAITEHVRRSSTWTAEYLEAIRAVRSTVEIVAGFEAKVLNREAELDIDPALGSRHLLIGSFHTFKPAEHYREAVFNLVAHPDVDILGHLGLCNGATIDLDEGDEDRLAKTIAEHGKTVELNARYGLPTRRMLERLMQYDVRLCFGSDAHSLREIGSGSVESELRRRGCAASSGER